MTRPRTRPSDQICRSNALTADRIAAYRRSAARPPVRVQVARLCVDLANLSALAAGGDADVARGAALAVAHAALQLAVTPVVSADDRRHRSDVLRGVVAAALVRAGLGHVMALVEAALATSGDPAGLGRGVRTIQ